MIKLTKNQLKALKYDKHIALTANAGSGKTAVLTARYIEIALNEPDVDLSSIAAITFTEKAAGELFKKISEEFDNRLANADKKTAELIKKRQRELINAHISTIHSFCKEILKLFPTEAGLGADFKVLDAFESKELIELTIDDFINKSLKNFNSDESKNVRDAIRLLDGSYRLKKALFYCVEKRRILKGVVDKIYRKDESEAIKYFNDLLKEFYKVFATSFKSLVLNSVALINDHVLRWDKNNLIALDAKNCIERFEDLYEKNDWAECVFQIYKLGKLILTKSEIAVKKRDYFIKEREDKKFEEPLETVKNYYLEFFDAFKDIDSRYFKVKELNKDKLSRNEEDKFDYDNLNNDLKLLYNNGKLIASIAENVIERYENEKLRQNAIDFEDMLIKTEYLLRDAKICQELGRKFKYIMVDEYQDTNEIQYNIFKSILNNLKSGNYFAVGDEKQSIYMFRNAEVEVFLQTKNDIKNTGGEDLTLPESFRMTKELAAFINKTFRDLFRKEYDFDDDIQYQDTICAKQSANPGKISFIVCSKSTETKEESDEADIDEQANDENDDIDIEAAAISNEILRLRENYPEVSFKDIAVLCRKRRYFLPLKRTFDKFFIPYVVEGDIGYFQSDVFKDVMNYFLFLGDQHDDVALLSILRSPFFFFSDDELFLLKSRYEAKNFFELLKIAANDRDYEFYEKCKLVCDILSENIILAKSEHPAKIARKILTESNYIAVAAYMDETGKKIANLNKLLDLLLDFEKRKFATYYDFVELLKNSYLKNLEEPEAEISEASNAVKIITTHQAKGLQYKVVFIYGCGDDLTAKRGDNKFVIDKNFGILFKLKSGESLKEIDSLLAMAQRFLNKRKEMREEIRIFYVAATRAEERLYFCGSLKEKKSSGSKDDKIAIAKNSYFGFLSKGLSNLGNRLTLTSNNTYYFENEKLQILSKKDNGEFIIQETISYPIDIIRYSLKDNSLRQMSECSNSNQIERQTLEACKIYSDDLVAKSVESGETYSATKILTYLKCPMRYRLIFELGFNKTAAYVDFGFENKNDEFVKKQAPYENFAERKNYFSKFRPDRNEKFSLSFGSLIHKLLELQPRKEDFDNIIDNLIKGYFGKYELTSEKSFFEKIIREYKNLATKIYLNFIESDFWKEIASGKDFRKEFEIIVKHEDFYIEGYIDRVNFNLQEKKAVIIEYKTDVIGKKHFDYKKSFYEKQTTLYAALLFKAFPELKTIDAYICFVRYFSKKDKKGKFIKQTLEKADAVKVFDEIVDIVRNIRKQKYEANYNHCAICSFYNYKEQKCIAV